MRKRTKLLIVTVVLMMLIAAGAFAKQNVEVHTFHVGINPFSWIWSDIKAEVGFPITGIFEVAGQIHYVNGEKQRDLFGAPLCLHKAITKQYLALLSPSTRRLSNRP